MNNHIQKNALLVGKDLPRFNEISPDEIQENIPILLKKLDSELTALEQEVKDKKELFWEDIMTPIHRIGERLRWSWGVVSHLNGVSNSDQLREAYSSQQADVVRFTNRMGQSNILKDALSNLKSKKPTVLDDTQKRILEIELISMHHRGVGLEGLERERFNSNSELLAELSTKFSNNVLDATKEWKLLLTTEKEVDGLPKRTLDALAKAAKDSNYTDSSTKKQVKKIGIHEGPWLLSLDMPSYMSVMTYSKNRSLRETVYKAYISRASKGNKSNEALIEEILVLRRKQANLLGYKNWAELSLATKMASSITQVEKLLEELRSAALPIALEEIKALKECAIRNNCPEANDFQPWDINFWSECLKQEQFNLNQEQLRPWFPLPNVLEGLFSLCSRLFDISIKPALNDYPKWHKDVQLFNVLDNNDSLIASFYLDPYSRPSSKRGGAWMDECLIREKDEHGKIVLPVAYLICNQTPPIGEMPSLMSFEEVKTLFHEFGHGLQHMLTTVDYPQAAGINNVEWDAVELPSQFMENWCLDKNTIMGIAKHWQTGEELPEKEFHKLKESKNFNSGLAMLRQVHFAITDLKLHSQWTIDLGIKPDQLRREIAETTTPIEPIKEDQYLCSFNHIFAGGYSAGYYSYKWAEVLSSDAFSAFEEIKPNDEDEIKKTGKRFRETILSMGGSKHPSEVFKRFRGRDSNTDALIRHSGLTRKS